jgi:AcrR family transcriptional regulator
MSQPAALKPSRPDVIRLARRLWLRGERLDVGQLAMTMGLGRATLFRWFGTRDLLLAEVLWSLCEPTLARAERESSGQGAARIAQISERALRLMQSFEPLRRFIAEDAEQALRLLTSRASPVQGRTIETVRRQLQAEVDAGWQPPLGLDTLAWLIVRIGESFLYASAISGQKVDIGDAGIAVQLLLSGRVESGG